MNQHSSNQPWIGLLVKEHLFSGDPLQDLTQSLDYFLPQGAGGHHPCLYSALRLIEEAAKTSGDGGKKGETIPLEQER
jgi:hypothetical protein